MISVNFRHFSHFCHFPRKPALNAGLFSQKYQRKNMIFRGPLWCHWWWCHWWWISTLFGVLTRWLYLNEAWWTVLSRRRAPVPTADGMYGMVGTRGGGTWRGRSSSGTPPWYGSGTSLHRVPPLHGPNLASFGPNFDFFTEISSFSSFSQVSRRRVDSVSQTPIQSGLKVPKMTEVD